MNLRVFRIIVMIILELSRKVFRGCLNRVGFVIDSVVRKYVAFYLVFLVIFCSFRRGLRCGRIVYFKFSGA